MTNYEKNKALLDMYAVANVSWGVDKNGEVSKCKDCTDCIFNRKGNCSHIRLEWLQHEYKEPEVEVDWTKVEVDTPILVKHRENAEWRERYFAGYIGGKVCTFDMGDTSENFVCINRWKFAKLAEQENGQK